MQLETFGIKFVRSTPLKYKGTFLYLIWIIFLLFKKVSEKVALVNLPKRLKIELNWNAGIYNLLHRRQPHCELGTYFFIDIHDQYIGCI